MTESAESHLRGHLFADLRGSTAFTEQAGNAAGAALVQRFRQLVRDEVGAHEGAEVKTEGDAIYVVFPSASTAVMCGLAIVAKADAASAENPDLPIRVGVGVHAGEAVAVPEGGYIGSAVNLAARVCSVAEAGEVLATGTVRSIAQQSIPVTFVPRGRRRLKGIADPVELYRVVPQGVTVAQRRGPSRRVLAGAALGVAAVIVVGALALLLAQFALPSEAKATPSPPPPTAAPVPTPQVPRIGALDIGEYATSQFQPPFDFTIANDGWSLTGENSGRASFLYRPAPGGTVDAGRISTVYENPCVGSGEGLPTINTTQELIDALQAQSFMQLGEVTPIFVSGWSGVAVDASVDPGVLAACDPGIGGVAVFPLGGTDYTVETGEVFKIYAFDVAGSNVAFVTSSNAPPETSVEELETFFSAARRLIDSVKF